MTKQSPYMKNYNSEDAADRAMRTKNRCNRMDGWLFVVVDGPDHGATVCDIRTAVEMGNGYRWAA